MTNSSSNEPPRVIPAGRVQVQGRSLAVPAPMSAESGAPRIALIEHGGEIRAIEVTCGCGKQVRLDCQYE